MKKLWTLIIGYFLLWSLIIGGLIYMAIHFIAKLW